MTKLFSIIILIATCFPILGQKADSLLLQDCYELYKQNKLKECFECFSKHDSIEKATYNSAFLAKELNDTANLYFYSDLLLDKFYSAENINAYLNLQAKDTVKCLKILFKGLKLFPKDTLLLEQKFIRLFNRGNFEAAHITSDTLFKYKRHINKELYSWKAAICEILKKENESIYFYKQALELDSIFSLANYNLGVIYHNKAIGIYHSSIPNIKSLYDKAISEAKSYLTKSLPHFEKAKLDSAYYKNAQEAINLIHYRLGISRKITSQ